MQSEIVFRHSTLYLNVSVCVFIFIFYRSCWISACKWAAYDFFFLVCLKKQLPVVRETVAVRGGFTGSQFERVPFILLFFLPR